MKWVILLALILVLSGCTGVETSEDGFTSPGEVAYAEKEIVENIIGISENITSAAADI